jgi:hypothetical protein
VQKGLLSVEFSRLFFRVREMADPLEKPGNQNSRSDAGARNALG